MINGTNNDFVPDFFIIGAPKAGTTSLASYLSEHSEICFSKIKEPFYFSSDYEGLIELNNIKNKYQYDALFLDKNKICGEGSTNYLASKVAVKSILEVNPDAKFIVMLRNPIDAAYAFHGELLHSLDEDCEDFSLAWDLQQERAKGYSIPKNCTAEQFLQYGEHFKYGEQIELLFSMVEKSNVLIIDFLDFVNNTRSIYKEVLDFLDINDDGRTEFTQQYASGKQRYSFVANLVLRPPSFAKPIIVLLRDKYRKQDGVIKRKIQKLMRKEEKRASMDESLRKSMSKFYHDDMLKLESLTGLDVSRWLR